MAPSDRPLALLTVIDSLGPGGAERSLAALAPHYRELGIELHVVVLFDRPGLQDELRDAGASLSSIGGSAKSRPTRVRQLSTLMRERRPDLVHTTLFEADVTGRVAAAIARIPCVSSLVNEAYGPEHAAEPGVRTSRLRLAQAVDAATARLTTRLHAVSEQVATVMAARLRYPRDRITVVPRGRDPRVLGRRTPERRASVRSALGLHPDDVAIIAVGRQEPQKAFEVLVEAFARVRAHRPSARLLLVGRDGAGTPAIDAAVRKFDVERAVVRLGERADVPDLLCAADVFAMTSRREGMPGAVIEAMALEVPVVASDLPQVREVTGDRGALLAPVDDVEAFADRIGAVVVDADVAAARAAAAYERFLRHFTVEETARQMAAFYEQARSGRRQRMPDNRSASR
jgi:glycosyltransferase involved in cell wall biosynthesis